MKYLNIEKMWVRFSTPCPIIFTYEFLSLFIAWVFRRNTCGYGNGRRYGNHTFVGACRRSRAKNCTMRQPFLFFAHERQRAKNARKKRAVKDGRNFVDDSACPCLFYPWYDPCSGFAVRCFTAGIWGVFNWTFPCGILSRIVSKRERNAIGING